MSKKSFASGSVLFSWVSLVLQDGLRSDQSRLHNVEVTIRQLVPGKFLIFEKYKHFSGNLSEAFETTCRLFVVSKNLKIEGLNLPQWLNFILVKLSNKCLYFRYSTRNVRYFLRGKLKKALH